MEMPMKILSVVRICRDGSNQDDWIVTTNGGASFFLRRPFNDLPEILRTFLIERAGLNKTSMLEYDIYTLLFTEK